MAERNPAPTRANPDQAVELRHLRCLVAIADAGTFTDAAIDLGISQASVSRTLAGLEDILGVQLVHRTNRASTLTADGAHVLGRARQILAEVEELTQDASARPRRLRVGHAWSAVGEHTGEFQRQWRARYPHIELRLTRQNTPSAGLAEGLSDVAVVRARIDARRYEEAPVGTERRYVAIAEDDPWRDRDGIALEDIRDRTLVIDRRTGTTTADLWPEGERPHVEFTQDIDDWLAQIVTGRCVGISPYATVTQYQRDGIVYRPLVDAPPVVVRLAWHRGDPNPAIPAAVDLLTELYANAGPDRLQR